MMDINKIISNGGGVVNLSKQLGINHSAIVRWKRIPEKRLVDVSRITGIPVDELRPDLAKIFKK